MVLSTQKIMGLMWDKLQKPYISNNKMGFILILVDGKKTKLIFLGGGKPSKWVFLKKRNWQKLT